MCHDAAVLTLPPSDPTHASCDPCGDESLDACVHASLLFSLESNCFGQAHVMYHVYEIKNIISTSIYFTEAANQGRPRNVNNRRKKQAASPGRQYYICTTQINYRIPTSQSINYSTSFQSDHESDSVYVLLVIAFVGCSLFFFQIFPSVDFSVLLVSRVFLFFFCFELDRSYFIFLLCFQSRRWGLPKQSWKVTDTGREGDFSPGRIEV
jgi:hypothetical protein